MILLQNDLLKFDFGSQRKVLQQNRCKSIVSSPFLVAPSCLLGDASPVALSSTRGLVPASPVWNSLSPLTSSGCLQEAIDFSISAPLGWTSSPFTTLLLSALAFSPCLGFLSLSPITNTVYTHSLSCCALWYRALGRWSPRISSVVYKSNRPSLNMDSGWSVRIGPSAGLRVRLSSVSAGLCHPLSVSLTQVTKPLWLAVYLPMKGRK